MRAERLACAYLCPHPSSSPRLFTHTRTTPSVSGWSALPLRFDRNVLADRDPRQRSRGACMVPPAPPARPRVASLCHPPPATNRRTRFPHPPRVHAFLSTKAPLTLGVTCGAHPGRAGMMCRTVTPRRDAGAASSSSTSTSKACDDCFALFRANRRAMVTTTCDRHFPKSNLRESLTTTGSPKRLFLLPHAHRFDAPRRVRHLLRAAASSRPIRRSACTSRWCAGTLSSTTAAAST